MNQILSVKLETNQKKLEKKRWFKFQFVFSIFIMSCLLLGGGFYIYYLGKKEDFSNRLIANYNISRLYSNSTQENKDNNHSFNPNNGLFGIIEIPKINLYYPVFSHLSEELLKISPCKFYGDSPDINGNICIAGHNYDNALFFSKIANLSQNDQIRIFDSDGTQYLYWVDNIYEVPESDLSPILNYDPDEKLLTLVTCNNFNSNRIIVRAKQKKLL